MMNTSILICALQYGGCGHVGKSTEWGGDETGDVLICPVCGEDRAFQLTKENFKSLTEDLWALQLHKARTLLNEYYGGGGGGVVAT